MKPSRRTTARPPAAPSATPAEHGELESRRPPQRPERILRLGPVHGEHRPDDLDLVGQAGVVETRPRADRDGRIRTPSSAHASAAATVVLPIPISPRATTPAPLVASSWPRRAPRAPPRARSHGPSRPFGRVGGAPTEREVEQAGNGRRRGDTCVDDDESRRRRAAQHGDRGAAGGEVGQHLGRDLLRIRAHAGAGDTVVSCRHDDHGVERRRSHVAPDRSDRDGELLEPSEAPRGFVLASSSGTSRVLALGVASRQGAHELRERVLDVHLDDSLAQRTSHVAGSSGRPDRRRRTPHAPPPRPRPCSPSRGRRGRRGRAASPARRPGRPRW